MAAVRCWRILLGILLAVASAAAVPQAIRQGYMPNTVTIFAVSEHAGKYSIEPIVMVVYGEQRFKTVPALNPPLPDNASDEDFDKLEQAIFKPGAQVSVFLGGEKVGTAAVVRAEMEGRGGGCSDLSATISYTGSRIPLLAANTGAEIPGHASTRRLATAAEAAILRRLAIQWFSEYGLDRQLLLRGRMEPVVSTVLRAGAGRALIGRFEVRSRRAVHRLFAIAEKSGAEYALTLALADVQHDVEDGVDQIEREFVDQIDVDNDGADDVITRSMYYESWNYAVWSFDAERRTWWNRYSGGGGGC